MRQGAACLRGAATLSRCMATALAKLSLQGRHRRAVWIEIAVGTVPREFLEGAPSRRPALRRDANVRWLLRRPSGCPHPPLP